MKSPLTAVVLLLSLVCRSVLSAQPGLDKKAADEAWDRATALAAPGAQRVQGNGPKTVEQAEAAVRDYAEQQKSAAQSAKDFQLQHPTDARVPAAKKLEATSALRSVWPLPPDRGQAAIQTAVAFSTDRTHAAKDRFEVMALLVAQQHKLRTNGQLLARDHKAHEQAADLLHREFGDIPEVFKFYLGVADAGDVATAHRAALKIVESPAPPALKTQAQVVIDRHALLGGSPAFALKDSRGRNVNLRQAGRPTVICVWSARHGGMDWGALAGAKQAAPANTQWVFVALDTTDAELDAALAKAPVPATHCLLNGAERAAFAKAVKLRRLPYVYTLEGGGILAGYGPVSELSRLLAPATR